MSSSPGASASPRRRLITSGLIVGGLLTLAPVFGLIGTVVGMMTAFTALGADDVAGDAGRLSVGIGQVLVSTVVGLILFIPGVVILTLSIIHHRRAKRAAAVSRAPSA